MDDGTRVTVTVNATAPASCTTVSVLSLFERILVDAVEAHTALRAVEVQTNDGRLVVTFEA